MVVAPSAFSVYTAALDSGCTSHTIKESCLPSDTVIDSSSTTHIQTAGVDATLPAFGRASNGIVQKALVVDDDKLAQNLVSVPKLDRMGYTITFKNGEGIVSDNSGTIITRAPLSSKDLYEFDIRELFAQNHSLLASATLDETDEATWHLRLGHRNVRDLRIAVNNNLVSGVPALKAKKR